jgi:hypothetical protein
MYIHPDNLPLGIDLGYDRENKYLKHLYQREMMKFTGKIIHV